MYEQIVGPPHPEMANPVMQWFGCDELSYVDGGVGIPVSFRWVDAGVAAPLGPPPAEAIAAGLYVQVQALMVGPAVATDPPEAARWLVRLPVFVEVTNWQGELVDDACVAGLCVTMTALPSLEFEPGEWGAPVVGCAPPGTRWDRAGSSPLEQASAPGACAWVYQLRSGVDGRPVEWPASVTVRWAVSWSASDGSSGSFPELAFTTGIPQAVGEVQTVVVDDE